MNNDAVTNDGSTRSGHILCKAAGDRPPALKDGMKIVPAREASFRTSFPRTSPTRMLLPAEIQTSPYQGPPFIKVPFAFQNGSRATTGEAKPSARQRTHATHLWLTRDDGLDPGRAPHNALECVIDRRALIHQRLDGVGPARVKELEIGNGRGEVLRAGVDRSQNDLVL